MLHKRAAEKMSPNYFGAQKRNDGVVKWSCGRTVRLGRLFIVGSL